MQYGHRCLSFEFLNAVKRCVKLIGGAAPTASQHQPHKRARHNSSHGHSLDGGSRPIYVIETLGHSSISVTMDTYGHLFPTEDRATIDALEKAFRDASSNISRPVDGLQFIVSLDQPVPKRRESPPRQGFSGVGLRGFEPPTFGPPDRRANQAAPQPVWLSHLS